MANEPAKTGDAKALSAYDRFVAYARDRASVEARFAASELESNQMNAILNATTEEELDAAMQMAGLTALGDLDDGTEIQINGYHLVTGSRADFANTMGVFAVIDAQRLSDGVQLALDTGVTRVIGFLRMVESGQLGISFPIQRTVRKVATNNGYSMVTLRPLSKRAVG